MVSKAHRSVDSAVRKTFGRSAISNGTRTLPDVVDGRSKAVRRFKDIAGAIVADQGGADRCAEARLQLIRRFAACAVMAEGLEARLADGEIINASEHALLCSSLVKIARQIGINRRTREVVPTLQSYLETRDERDDDEEADE
jgi:hypothetical protein